VEHDRHITEDVLGAAEPAALADVVRPENTIVACVKPIIAATLLGKAP
jgi:hypothetical protein